MNIKSPIRSTAVVLGVFSMLIMSILVIQNRMKTTKTMTMLVSPPNTDKSTQNTTDNMQKYENREYGFVMYYPRGWSSNSTTDRNANPVIFAPVEQNAIVFQIEQIHVDFSREFPFANTKEYVEKDFLPSQKGSVCEGRHTLNRNVPAALRSYDITVVEGLCGVLDQGPFAVIQHKGRRISISSSMIQNITADIVYQILEKIELH